VKHAMEANYSFVQISYQDALFGCAGMLFWAFSQCLAAASAPWKVKATWFIEKFCVGFCVYPCVMQTTTMTAFCLPPRQCLALNLLISVGSMLPPMIIGYALWTPLERLRPLADPTPQVLVAAAEVLITTALFNKHRPWRTWIGSLFRAARGQKFGDASVDKDLKQPAPTSFIEQAPQHLACMRVSQHDPVTDSKSNVRRANIVSI